MGFSRDPVGYVLEREVVAAPGTEPHVPVRGALSSGYQWWTEGLATERGELEASDHAFREIVLPAAGLRSASPIQ